MAGLHWTFHFISFLIYSQTKNPIVSFSILMTAGMAKNKQHALISNRWWNAISENAHTHTLTYIFSFGDINVAAGVLV